MSGEDLKGTGLRSCLAIDYNNNEIINYDSDSDTFSDNESNNDVPLKDRRKNVAIVDYTNLNTKLNNNHSHRSTDSSDNKNHSSTKKSKKNSATKARQVSNFRKKTGDEIMMVLQAIKATSTRMNTFQNIFKILLVRFFLLIRLFNMVLDKYL